MAFVRENRAPALLRLTVPRLEGHSFQDTQAYKSENVVRAEWARDPLPRLKDYLVPAVMSAEDGGIPRRKQRPLPRPPARPPRRDRPPIRRPLRATSFRRRDAADGRSAQFWLRCAVGE